MVASSRPDTPARPRKVRRTNKPFIAPSPRLEHDVPADSQSRSLFSPSFEVGRCHETPVEGFTDSILADDFSLSVEANEARSIPEPYSTDAAGTPSPMTEVGRRHETSATRFTDSILTDDFRLSVEANEPSCLSNLYSSDTAQFEVKSPISLEDFGSTRPVRISDMVGHVENREESPLHSNKQVLVNLRTVY